MNKKQLEAAARKYCEITGQDPDERVSHGADPGPGGLTPMILLHSPLWTRIAREIESHDALMQAVEFGRSYRGGER